MTSFLLQFALNSGCPITGICVNLNVYEEG